MPLEIYKAFGPISVIIGWTAIGFLIYKWRGDRSMSISKHAAAHKGSYVLMLVVESIVLPMFFIFVAKWIVPTFDLPNFFTICVGIASLGLLVAAWIPDTRGLKSVVHGLASYTGAVLFIPALTILYVSSNIFGFAKYFTLAVLVYEIVAMVVFTVIEEARNYHLWVQAGYILLFDLVLLTVAYIR